MAAAPQNEASREKAIELIAGMLMQRGGSLVDQARKKAEAGESLDVKGVKVDAEMLKEALRRSGALLKQNNSTQVVTSVASSARWQPSKGATSSSRWRPGESDISLSARALAECEAAEVFQRSAEVSKAAHVKVFPKPNVLLAPLQVQLGEGPVSTVARWCSHADGRVYLRLKEPEGWVSTRSVDDLSEVVIRARSGEASLEPMHYSEKLESKALEVLPSLDMADIQQGSSEPAQGAGEDAEGEAEEAEEEGDGDDAEEGEEECDGEGDEEEEIEGDEEMEEAEAPPKEGSPAKASPAKPTTRRFRVTHICPVLPRPGMAMKKKGLPSLPVKKVVTADAVVFIPSEQRAYLRLHNKQGWISERSFTDIRRLAVLPARSSKLPVSKKMAKGLVYRGLDAGGATHLKKEDLVKNVRGKVVSKKASEAAQKRYANSSISKWQEACKRARADLGIVGFAVAKRGTPLYEKAQQYFKGDAAAAASAASVPPQQA
mmetsp:Transcript_69881/g.167741  ORF Transcript_69881/g.167741 Transcript_69881/m.167741 type:complete len:489 (+) Transcript_69881:186-1652(+)